MSVQGKGRTLPSQETTDTGKVLGAVDTAGPDGGTAWVDAGAAAFTPDEPTDWTGPPTTVQEALDELAARLTIAE
jgi:hypothetical protein